jgi:hypothetical protein
VARHDGASLEDFTGEYAWMGARNVGTVTDKEADSTFRALCLYCAVSVKVTTGCPSANCPSAVTCTVPGAEGSVSTTAAFPEESVVTIRLESKPAVVVKKIVPPPALPPDCPALSVTDRFNLLPASPF